MPSDTLTNYLAEVDRHPLLTPGQEARLARRGDPAARRRLIEGNLRLVVAIARSHRGRGLELADLIQEGNVGLIAAAEHYDWRREVPFAAYASPWIRGAIRRGLTLASRLPRRLAEHRAGVDRAEERLAQRLGRRPTLDEVAREAGVASGTVADLRRARLIPISLSEPVDETIAADPALRVIARDDTPCLEAMLRALDPRSRRVLELRYALDGGEERTLEQVADELGISRERVRRLHTRSLLALAERAA